MPETIFSVAEDIRRCTQCPLWKNRLLAVPGEGRWDAKVMLIGEAPGAEEDRQGIPFVGKSGQYLTTLLNTIDVERENVFMTSCVKCRPLENRAPTSTELCICKETWLLKQIELLNPVLIIVVGGVALRTVLGKNGVHHWHGKVIQRNGRRYFVTFHPAAALRFPHMRDLMEKDFKTLKKIMKLFVGDPPKTKS